MGKGYGEQRDMIPIDFSSVRSLPDSHAWGEYDDEINNGGGGSSSIPIIDLVDPNAVELIGHACENWGTFQLKNHGITLSLIEAVEAEAKCLFALPAHQKLKALRSPTAFTGYGTALISPFFPKYMWHEGFTIMGSPSRDAHKIWPNHHARFCDIMENYQKQMKQLAEQLTSLIFKFLGISEEEKKWDGSSSSKSSAALQLNSYPCCPDPERAMGLAPHTDTSLLTILHQSQTSQAHLQVFKQGVGWVLVHPNPAALVVNTGDILHIISNARIPCVLHRVTVNRNHQRYSIAYFYGPPSDYLMSPLPTALSNSPPRFCPLTVRDYVAIKANNLEDALSSIAT